MREKESTSAVSLQSMFSLEGLVWIVSICYIVFYLYVAFQRIVYPYDLDFIEDNILTQAVRVSLGQPVYLPLNADFVPQVYTPLYPWLGGEIFKITGPSFLPLRLLSFSATIVTAILIFWVSRRISDQPSISLFAVGLFLAGYHTTGGWYELARVDALYVMLTLLGAMLAIYGMDSRFQLALSGATLALAFLTKQNGLFFAFVVGLYLLLKRKQVWSFALSFLLISVIPVIWLNEASHGWFSFYAIKIAYIGPIDLKRVTATFENDLFGSMIGLTIPFLFVVASLFWHGRWKSLLAEPWNWCIAAALFISIAGRASVGGNRNNLMPAYTLLCLAPALAARETSLWRDRWQVGTRSVLLVLIVIQFVLTSFVPKYPANFVPTQSMKNAGDQLIHDIADVPGPVLVLMHPYYALLAGKEPGVDFQMLWLARWKGEEPLPDDLVMRIENHYYSEIISDGTSPFESDPTLVSLLQRYYILHRAIPSSESPYTLTGVIVRPKQIYVPKRGS